MPLYGSNHTQYLCFSYTTRQHPNACALRPEDNPCSTKILCRRLRFTSFRHALGCAITTRGPIRAGTVYDGREWVGGGDSIRRVLAFVPSYKLTN